MTKAVRERLDILTFGSELLRLRDLDPVYTILYNAKLDRDDLWRWLIAYWCFYHVGTSSWIAESADGYWGRMLEAAGSKEYPRAHERRHFRGALALKSAHWLRSQGVGRLRHPFRKPRRYSLVEVMKEIQTWVGFGPWIAFKAADMLERLDLCRIVFNDGAMFLFDSPKEGAERLWIEEMEGKLDYQEERIPDDVGPWAVKTILDGLGDDLKAPPRFERSLNAQEAETILCKWKSYGNGHYRLGEDVEACREGLRRFPESKVAHRLIEGGKVGGLW